MGKTFNHSRFHSTVRDCGSLRTKILAGLWTVRIKYQPRGQPAGTLPRPCQIKGTGDTEDGEGCHPGGMGAGGCRLKGQITLAEQQQP